MGVGVGCRTRPDDDAVELGGLDSIRIHVLNRGIRDFGGRSGDG